MKKRLNSTLSAKHLRYGTALALVSFFAGNQAFAQDTKPAAAQEAKPGSDAALVAEETIVVVGTRASQQSAITRKKNAKTAMDSIVAEDVGAFPDRNIGEAISRIAGVALDRGDMGEGVNVTVRGNGPDLTRVEIDGQGVQSGGGASAAMNGDISQGGSGRGQGFRDLPSDLIKSVDVVKGSTADMTEGALGGGIIIKTRTGLDFKKPYISVRVAAAQGSMNKTVQPDLNLVATTKFFDNRLGILLNASGSKVTNEGHNVSFTDNSRGYTHALDFDNSPEKTFTFNPNTVSTVDKAATDPITTLPLTAGGNWVSESPLSFVKKAAAAQTKADCYAAFPPLTATQIGALVPGKTTGGIGANVTTAYAQRSNELMSCLNQWNDFTPSNIRYIVRRDVEARRALDLRFDFKVNNDLSVYAKGSSTSRVIANTFETYSLGGMLSVNPGTISTIAYAGPTSTDVAGVRSAVAGSGYSLFNNNVSFLANSYPVTNVVTNFVPGSVVVDAKHHVTSYSFTGGGNNTDQSDTDMVTKSKYFQVGGAYKKGGLIADFFVGDARSDFSRDDRRTNWGTSYGAGSLRVLPNGLWTYDFPASSTFDQTNPALYAQINPNLQAATAAVPASGIPAYTSVQKPKLSINQPQLNAQALRLNETDEKTAKLDVTYNLQDKLPFITTIKAGLNLRDTSGEGWGNGGATIKAAIGTFGQPGYQAAIILPNNALRGNLIACEDTAGSLGAGGQPCVYGYVAKTDPLTSRAGTVTVTQPQLQNIIAQSMKPPSAQFFAGLPDRGDLFNGWNQIDVKKFYSLVGAPNFNFDCLKSCTATDGKVYDQPHGSFSEKTKAGYLMADFEKNGLPFGMEFTANLGARVVNTEVTGSGFITFNSIAKVQGVYDPVNPNAVGGTTTVTIVEGVNIHRTTTDLLPAYNYALWVIPSKVVLRYTLAKTVARPAVGILLPAGTCEFDERKLDLPKDSDGSNADMGCSTFGNPSLKAQTNSNQNLSIEWYPNKDYMFSLAAFRQNAKIGPARLVTVFNSPVFAGSDVVDPQTGIKLSDIQYTLRTYQNGPGTDRHGLEFASKSAFTFLPWAFKYTGLDLNYSKLKSSDSVTVRDLNSGDSLPPTGESAYAINASLWYDDGSLTARIAYQSRGASFINLSGTSGSSALLFDYPADGVTAPRFPYNPTAPNFKDSTHYIDAKIAYKFKSGVEIFAEGRNLGLSTTSNSSGGYNNFASGAPSLNDYFYTGRRIMAGFNYRH